MLLKFEVLKLIAFILKSELLERACAERVRVFDSIEIMNFCELEMGSLMILLGI